MNLTRNLDKLGIFGLLITALFSPCCFPLFAFAGSALGLGSFELFGGYTLLIFQALVLISIGGLYLSYRSHRCKYPLLIAVPSGLLIFYASNFNESDYWTYFIYAGMFGIFIATLWNFKRNKIHGSCNPCSPSKNETLETQSTLTCPNCHHEKTEIMPSNACVYFYECEKCKTLLKPLQGDCCVYCSYGTVKCPPIQLGEKCC